MNNKHYITTTVTSVANQEIINGTTFPLYDTRNKRPIVEKMEISVSESVECIINGTDSVTINPGTGFLFDYSDIRVKSMKPKTSGVDINIAAIYR